MHHRCDGVSDHVRRSCRAAKEEAETILRKAKADATKAQKAAALAAKKQAKRLADEEATSSYTGAPTQH